MRIRQEQPADYREVYRLLQLSFATTSNDGEWDYLNQVRQKPQFIPQLSLVAEEDDKIVGQIVLYQTDITTQSGVKTELLLSPICVHPDYFLRGIARAMTAAAFETARKLGYTAVFLCGEPEIYHRLGFRPTWRYGIYHVSDRSRQAEWCMALELVPGALEGVTGTIDIV